MSWIMIRPMPVTIRHVINTQLFVRPDYSDASYGSLLRSPILLRSPSLIRSPSLLRSHTESYGVLRSFSGSCFGGYGIAFKNVPWIRLRTIVHYFNFYILYYIICQREISNDSNQGNKLSFQFAVLLFRRLLSRSSSLFERQQLSGLFHVDCS